MSKSAVSTHDQDECGTFKHDLTGDFDDTETVCPPVDPVEVIEVAVVVPGRIR